MGTDIISYLDVGNVATFDFASNLPEGSDIYVSITPYNEQGTSFDPGESTTLCGTNVFYGSTYDRTIMCSVDKSLNGETDVSVEADLVWNAPVGAQGYRVSVGTSPGGNEVVNNEDVGNVTSYDFPNYLPDNRPVYVMIIPYNSVGDAVGCVEETFTTETLLKFHLVLRSSILQMMLPM